MFKDEKRIEHILDSGIEVWVTPLNRYQRVALEEAAREQFPLPDKKAFEKPIEGDVIEGLMLPADQNPEYLALKEEAERNQNQYLLRGMIDICVVFPKFGTRQELIDYFADYIALQRKYMALPEDDWDATFQFGVIRSVQDESLIYSTVREQLPLTDAEVIQEIRLFRYKVSRK